MWFTENADKIFAEKKIEKWRLDTLRKTSGNRKKRLKARAAAWSTRVLMKVDVAKIMDKSQVATFYGPRCNNYCYKYLWRCWRPTFIIVIVVFRSFNVIGGVTVLFVCLLLFAAQSEIKKQLSQRLQVRILTLQMYSSLRYHFIVFYSVLLLRWLCRLHRRRLIRQSE